MSEIPVHSKRELLLKLMRERAAQTGINAAAAPLLPVHRSETMELSFAQERLWVLDRIRPGRHNNLLVQFELEGHLDEGALRRSLDAIIERHEILRTTFPQIDGLPVQRIAAAVPIQMRVADLGSVPETLRSAEISRAIAPESEVQFDLQTGPLLTSVLVRVSELVHVLVLSIHHILVDGWSITLMHRELAAFYGAFTSGASTGVPELPIQYADFAHWQRQSLASSRFTECLDYWKRQLERPPTPLELPFDRPPMAARSIEGGIVRVALDPELEQQVRDFSRCEGVTLYTTLLTALNTLMMRYTGQEDLAIGTIVADRPTSATEDMVGLFLNTLVLRADYSGDPTARCALRRTRDVVLQAQAHAEYPFYALVNELRPERDAERSPYFHSPFFDVVFNMQSSDGNATIAAAKLQITKLPADDHYRDVDTLTVFGYDTRDRLEVMIGYNRALFDRQTIERLAGHFGRLLAALVSCPESRLSALPLLVDSERESLLAMTRGPSVPVVDEGGYGDYFELQVAKTPSAIAVIGDEQILTYEELNARADHVAALLAAHGVRTGEPVGVCAEAGASLLGWMIGCLKAGGAYMPLDPRYPGQRKTAILRQSGARFLLIADSLAPSVRSCLEGMPAAARPLLLTQGEIERWAAIPAVRRSPVASDVAAYVIFTSGSTGDPKGAMVSHRAMLNHFLQKIRILGLGSGDVVAQTAPMGFDISIWQFLAPLLAGATVRILAAQAAEPLRLFESVDREGVTVAQVVPSLLRAFLDGLDVEPSAGKDFVRLRTLLLVGEALAPDLARRWLTRWPEIALVNGYGPSECADEATRYLVDKPPTAESTTVPIGRPVDNVRVYVLDGAAGLLPVGVAGELCIAGAGVGLGYINDPDRSAAVFVKDPYGADGERMYRTGDRGRARADGTLEFLGRLDFQVKIRGHRIELGEIETLLLRHFAVREAVVHPWRANSGDRLVAYVVPRDPAAVPTGDQLQAHLSAWLPSYMVPQEFVTLPALPLNRNGKVDRLALPEPIARLTRALVDPRTPMESTVAEVWRRVIGLSRIGIHDNFFELGGHSLLAAQAAAQLRSRLGFDIGIRPLFEYRSLADLAAYLESERQQAELGRERMQL